MPHMACPSGRSRPGRPPDPVSQRRVKCPPWVMECAECPPGTGRVRPVACWIRAALRVQSHKVKEAATVVNKCAYVDQDW